MKALLLVLAGAGAAAASETAREFTLYSQPIRLRHGQVYNHMQSDNGGVRLPEDVIERYRDGKVHMAMTGFQIEMVRKSPDGGELPVKLNDHYMHHYIHYLGDQGAMREVVEAADRDPELKHMLTSCHGMSGAGLSMYRDRQLAAGKKPEAIYLGTAGAEYRHNPQGWQAPFRKLIHKPEVWMPVFHIINMQDDKRTPSPLLGCPCTPQRKIDVKNGTIDGKVPYPPIYCSKEFMATGNPSCSLATYTGGWRCCEHSVFLIDTDKECKSPDCAEKPVDEIYVKATFTYEDEQPETVDIMSLSCCDITGGPDDGGFVNIEHDVPACAPGTPPEACVWTHETVQPINVDGGHGPGPPPSSAAAGLVGQRWERPLLDLVHAAPHLHVAGLEMELIDHVTNKTLCKAQRGPNGAVIYGTGQEPGNEEGYLVGLLPCTWGPKDAPGPFPAHHPIRTRTVYNATQNHTGVMSLWILMGAKSFRAEEPATFV